MRRMVTGKTIKKKNGYVAVNDKFYVNDDGKVVVDDLKNVNDKNGRPLVIEGSCGDFANGKVTTTYSKWSLSGTHLMCVLCGTIPSGESIASLLLNGFTLPEYISSKINPLLGSDNVSYITVYALDSTNFNINMKDAIFVKQGNNFNVYMNTTITPTNISSIRIQIDLLIDAD